MGKMGNATAAVQEQTLEAIRRSQETFLKTVHVWSSSTRRLTPTWMSTPLGRQFIQLSELVDDSIDFVDRWFDGQRRFTRALLECAAGGDPLESFTRGPVVSADPEARDRADAAQGVIVDLEKRASRAEAEVAAARREVDRAETGAAEARAMARTAKAEAARAVEAQTEAARERAAAAEAKVGDLVADLARVQSELSKLRKERDDARQAARTAQGEAKEARRLSEASLEHARKTSNAQLNEALEAARAAVRQAQDEARREVDELRRQLTSQTAEPSPVAAKGTGRAAVATKETGAARARPATPARAASAASSTATASRRRASTKAAAKPPAPSADSLSRS